MSSSHSKSKAANAESVMKTKKAPAARRTAAAPLRTLEMRAKKEDKEAAVKAGRVAGDDEEQLAAISSSQYTQKTPSMMMHTLAQIDSEPKSKLTLDEKMTELKSLTSLTGESIINIKIPNWAYELGGLIYAIGFDEAISHFKTALAKSTRTKDIIFNTPVFYEQRLNEKYTIYNQTRELELQKGIYPCRNPRCKSINTTHTSKQVRSADEGMTDFVICQDCDFKFTVG